ncbi:MAG TPA: HNH endonuclease signature motif containing protein [Terriglobales bacterium]|nr:HNH endonuclease signature motif containing protein [Terriglobales bacterium]
MPKKMPPFEEYFWSKVDRRGSDECWPWLACRHNPQGYGLIRRDKRQYRAHRVAWELHHGTPFPEGKDACHSCDNPWCVNPAHIWPGTARDNIRDAVAKGRVRPPVRGSRSA